MALRAGRRRRVVDRLRLTQRVLRWHDEQQHQSPVSRLPKEKEGGLRRKEVEERNLRVPGASVDAFR